jgi:hypothetical protein
LGGTRHDKESLKRWFERVGIVLPDLKFDVYEDTKTVSNGLDVQFESGINEAKAPKIES